MSWTCAGLLALLIMLLALSLSPEADSAAVTSSRGSHRYPRGPPRRIFMKEAEASNFFRRGSRRGFKSWDKNDAEQRQIQAADARKREFHEEKRKEFESDAEEEHGEHDERTRESAEQWREFHYDGMHPPQENNRRIV